MIDALFRLGYSAAYRVLRVWWFVRRPDERGAFVAVWHGDELLLIRNSYRTGETLPCGHIGRRESPRAAARRELREEVGIDVADDDLLEAAEFRVEHDFKHERAFFFELRPGVRPEIRVDRREVVWGEFVPESELDTRPLVPHLRLYLSWLREGPRD